MLRGETVYLHYPKGLSSTGVNARPLARLPLKATVLKTGAELKAELTALPRDWKKADESLHVYGIPTDRLDGESVVIRLDFQ